MPIPTRNPLAKRTVFPPVLINNAGAATTTIFDSAVDGPLGQVVIQNCGVAPIKYAFNTSASDVVFHGVLAACGTVDDGLGSLVSITDEASIVSISIYGAAAHRAAISKFIARNN